MPKKTRGRIGGYGRTGQFLKVAEFNTWYTSQQIMKWFHSQGDYIKYSQAKTVFESLDRGKCHRTRKKLNTKRPAIMLLPPLPNISPVPDDLKSVCQISIKEYLTVFMLTNPFGTPLKTKRKEYQKNSKELMKVAKMQSEGIPIEFDDSLYSIAGWELVNNTVHVLFKEIHESKILRTKKENVELHRNLS